MNKVSFVIAIAGAVSLGACAGVPEHSQLAPPVTLAAARKMIGDGKPAMPPPGYVSFCMQNLQACTAKVTATNTVVLNDDVRAKLIAVNQKINDAIVYQTDMEQYGVLNMWTLNAVGGYGNCKDYVLAKRQRLLAEGFPSSALRIAIVRTPQDALHAVLTVDTDRGDFVLDSLTSNIMPWSSTQYRWLTRQSAADPIRWVHVAD